MLGAVAGAGTRRRASQHRDRSCRPQKKDGAAKADGELSAATRKAPGRWSPGGGRRSGHEQSSRLSPGRRGGARQVEKKGEGPVQRRNGQREALPVGESVCSSQKVHGIVLGAGFGGKMERAS